MEELDAGIIDEEEMNRRMTPLVMYKGITHALSSMHNPENMRALFAHTSPPGLSPAEQEERWLRIAETFDDMPEEQAAVCLSNYHLFQERLKDLTARQVATVEAIHRVGSQAVLGGPPVTSVAGAASSMQGVALSALVERYLHLVDATSQYSSYSGACEGGGGGGRRTRVGGGARRVAMPPPTSPRCMHTHARPCRRHPACGDRLYGRYRQQCAREPKVAHDR